jgi:dienelactone hydrolase
MVKRWLATIGALLTFLLATTMVRAEIKVQTVDYKIGDSEFEGYLFDDATKQGKHPAVVIFPAWTGISDNEREHAQRPAELGYVVFVADTYGKGVHPKPPSEAGAEASKYMKDRDLIAAIGYCFGGAGALELGRSGAEVKAVVVFHGDLTSPTPEDDKNIKGRVLALHGADDPIVPAVERDKFENEMRAAHVDWQLVTDGGAVHCFTDAQAGNDLSHGCAYNAQAEQRSWRAMLDFFKDAL